MRKLNPDIMNMLPTKDAANATMYIIDKVQDLTPEQQIVAITASFKLLTERFNVEVRDAFNVADNIMNHAQGRRVEFEAVREYLKNEV